MIAAAVIVTPVNLFAVPYSSLASELTDAQAAGYPRETLSSRLQRIKQAYKIGLTFDSRRTGAVIVPAARQVSAEQDIANCISSSKGFAYRKQGRLYTVYSKPVQTDVQRTAPVRTTATEPQQSQRGTLRGTVMDKSGSPIPGATILFPEQRLQP